MNAVNFDRNAFEAMFSTAIDALTASEKVTKETLKDVSRSILEAVHITGDIGFVNRLIMVLSPMNKKTAVIYFKHFTGFKYDDQAGVFVKKNKKVYDDAKQATIDFLADPHNNIWTWADRNIQLEQKPFDISKVTSYVTNALKKAKENGLTEADVIRAVFKSGVSLDAVVDCLDVLGAEGALSDATNSGVADSIPM